MPYISFKDYPNAPGRQYRDTVTDPVSGLYVCEVDEVLEGETSITEEEHAKIKAAAEAAYVEPEPVPIPAEKRAPTLEDILAVLPEDLKLALDARMEAKTNQVLGAQAEGPGVIGI